MSENRKRYIISSRLGQTIASTDLDGLRSFLARHPKVLSVRTTCEYYHVVAMTDHEARELQEGQPKLIIEEDAPIQLFDRVLLPYLIPTGARYSLDVEVRDETDDKPIPGINIRGFGAWFRDDYRAQTDEEGRAVLQVEEPVLMPVVALPSHSYWSRVVNYVDVTIGQSLLIKLKPLLTTGAYDWGHRLMGFRAVNPRFLGKGIRVAVVDSGVSDQSGDLKVVGGFNTLDGGDPAAWNLDEQGHGTHVAGIVAALNNAVGVVGGAPDAQIYSLKVFPGLISGVIDALEWSIQNNIDIINLGLGLAHFKYALASAIYRAWARGVTCIAAAGNDRSTVAYPAALPTTIAVSAIGRFGTFPEDSQHVQSISSNTDRYGGLFAASFNNFGPWVDVCAPGIAVLSTVPGGYAAWDGTSMACSAITALAALILEAYPAFRTGDANQVEAVRAILRRASLDLGIHPWLQGAGLPLAPDALRFA